MAPTPIPVGKLPSDLLAELLATFRPLPDDVLVGPAVGEDACALAVPAGLVVAATDPITLTGGDVGRYAVAVNANDVAVTGIRPRWFLATVLLPTGTTRVEVEALFEAMRRALVEVGAVLVGGHTEVSEAVTQPVVVGQMLGSAPSGTPVVTTAGARPGDVVVQVGPAPVEGAAVLAERVQAPPAVPDPDVLRAAVDATTDPGISVVEPALAAAELGATALHDPTEGGLAGGLHELSDAAGVAVQVDREAVIWFEPGLAVCRAVGADPWATLASGALLATFAPADATGALAGLADRGHRAAEIGVLAVGRGVHDRDGRPLPRPARDEVARLAAP